MLPTCYRLISETSLQQVVLMEFGKRHDTLLNTPACYRLIADLLRGNWCNGFWPLLSEIDSYTTADKDAQQSMVIIIIIIVRHHTVRRRQYHRLSVSQ